MKITEEIAAQLYKDYQSKFSIAELSRKYKIARPTVYYVIKRSEETPEERQDRINKKIETFGEELNVILYTEDEVKKIIAQETQKVISEYESKIKKLEEQLSQIKVSKPKECSIDKNSIDKYLKLISKKFSFITPDEKPSKTLVKIKRYIKNNPDLNSFIEEIDEKLMRVTNNNISYSVKKLVAPIQKGHLFRAEDYDNKLLKSFNLLS